MSARPTTFGSIWVVRTSAIVPPTPVVFTAPGLPEGILSADLTLGSPQAAINSATPDRHANHHFYSPVLFTVDCKVAWTYAHMVFYTRPTCYRIAFYIRITSDQPPQRRRLDHGRPDRLATSILARFLEKGRSQEERRRLFGYGGGYPLRLKRMLLAQWSGSRSAAGARAAGRRVTYFYFDVDHPIIALTVPPTTYARHISRIADPAEESQVGK